MGKRPLFRIAVSLSLLILATLWAGAVPTYGGKLDTPPEAQKCSGTTSAPDCDQATYLEDSMQPPTPYSGNTTGAGDNYQLEDGNCKGGGTAYPLTGVGEDLVYKITTDKTCSLEVTLDPTGSDDLALYVLNPSCGSSSSNVGNCVIVDDSGSAGVTEQVEFVAEFTEDYYIIVDGYDSSHGEFELTISETTSTYCNLSNPDHRELGDAPDSSNHALVPMWAYYPVGLQPGVEAHFPTTFDPDVGGLPGPMHWNPGLGPSLGGYFTLERDADGGGYDWDGIQNISPMEGSADQDGGDDGLRFPLELPHCSLTSITYTVRVTPDFSNSPFFVNMWFDFNRDGDWDDILDCSGLDADEWAVQDHVVNLAAGSHTLTSPFLLPYHLTPGKPIWMRMMISESPAEVDAALHADGHGPVDGYLLGETEDYYLRFFDGSYYYISDELFLPFVTNQ